MAKKYKAADLCRELGIQPYVLRYWETEFPALRDEMIGSSTYTADALDVARRIKALLYDEGYTIVGAKKKLTAPEPEIVQTTLPTGEEEPGGEDEGEPEAESSDAEEAEAEDADEDVETELEDGEEEWQDEDGAEDDFEVDEDSEDTEVLPELDEDVLSDSGSDDEELDQDDADDEVEEDSEPVTEDDDEAELEEVVEEDVSESEVLDTIDSERIERVARRAVALRDLAAQLLSDLRGSDDR